LGRDFDVIAAVLSGPRERTTMSICVVFVKLKGIGIGFRWNIDIYKSNYITLHTTLLLMFTFSSARTFNVTRNIRTFNNYKCIQKSTRVKVMLIVCCRDTVNC
jgi:hypothetical protein